jgi:hypothetical protein
MTHNELLDKIYWYWRRDNRGADGLQPMVDYRRALLKVVELHKPTEAWGDTHCGFCFDLAWEPSGLQMDSKQFIYPCPTIQAIEKELS